MFVIIMLADVLLITSALYPELTDEETIVNGKAYEVLVFL